MVDFRVRVLPHDGIASGARRLRRTRLRRRGKTAQRERRDDVNDGSMIHTGLDTSAETANHAMTTVRIVVTTMYRNTPDALITGIGRLIIRQQTHGEGFLLR